MKSRKSAKGTDTAALDKYAKEFDARLADAEFKIEDFKEALMEKLDKADYAALASDKVTK